MNEAIEFFILFYGTSLVLAGLVLLSEIIRIRIVNKRIDNYNKKLISSQYKEYWDERMKKGGFIIE